MVECVGEGFGDDPADVVVGGAVVDPIAVAAAGDQPGPAQLGEMLRHGRMT
jgi:hypothetical protein